MEILKEKIIKEFRNKFGGDVWLGGDRKTIEDFISKAISQVQAEILQVVLEDVPWKYQDRLIKLLK